MRSLHLSQVLSQIALLLIAILMGITAVYAPIMLTAVLIGIALAGAVAISPLSIFALMLILAPLRTLIATESAFQLPLDIGQLSFIGFVLVWWWHRTIRKQQSVSIQLTPIFIAITLFTIAVSLTAFSAISMQFWLTEWLKWVTVLVTIVVVGDLGRGQRWQWMMTALVAAGVGNSIIGLYIFFGGSGADHLLINGRFFRAFGTFGQPNPYGGFLGIILPIAMMFSYSGLLHLWNTWRLQRNLNYRALFQVVLFGCATGIMLAGLVASWSRGAWLGFVVSVGVMAFCLPRKLWQSVLLSVTALLLVGGMWFAGLIPASIQQRVLSSTEELFSFADVRGVDITTTNYAIVERLAHWQAAINMARENFWLGVGLGNYEVAYPDYRLINWEFPLGHAHNYYLNILGEAGMIGFLFYMGMWVTIVLITWQMRSHPDLLARSLSVGMMGSWAYLAFHSLLDNLYVNNVFLHLGVIFGVLAIFYQQVNGSTRRGNYVPSIKRGTDNTTRNI